MFLGDYIHTLDEKGRVVLPSSFRGAIKEDGGHVVVTKGSDGNLALFTKSKFDEIAREELERPRDRAARREARAKFGAADLQKMDSQGRVMLKSKLREYASLDDVAEVAVIGMYDRIEVWQVDAFEAEQAASDELYRNSEEVPGF